jgi:hypothetical protein
MSIIQKSFKQNGVLIDPTSVILSDPTATYGVKRNDNDAVVVADGTAMTKVSTGIYRHEFDDPANDLTYTYYLEAVIEGETYHVEGTLTGPVSSVAPTVTVGTNCYISVADATTYYDSILDAEPWDDATAANKARALLMATKAIDNLNYVGDKADEDQALEFPREDDTDIPTAIEEACCEIAIRLLDGNDPEIMYENLRMTSQGFASVRSTYSMEMIPDYILAGLSSVKAWKLLLPYLRDTHQISVQRMS